MVVLLGFAGLAIDVGLFCNTKRQMQTAADAAAIAAATALRKSQNYQAAAQDLSSFNGFTNSQQGVTVTVNNPPLSGPRTTDPSFVEVVVTKPSPTYFMRILGPASVNISARAVSGSANAQFCMYALDPTAPGALNTDNAMVSSCGIMVNSSHANAITVPGSITAPLVGVVGGISGAGRVAGRVRSAIAPAPVRASTSGRRLQCLYTTGLL